MMELYKQAVGKNPVPPELIAKTASSIRQAQKKVPRCRFPTIAISAAACVTLAVALGILFFRSSDREPDIYITTHSGNHYIQSVELMNGSIDFYSETQPVHQLILSGSGVFVEEWTQAKYWQYLGMEPAFEHLPSDLVLHGESAVVYTVGDRVLWDYNTLSFESDDGSTLEITVSKGSLPPGKAIDAEANSSIKGNALAVGFDPDNNTYWAQFIYEEVGYFIESKNISQETFIRILHGIFG